MLARRLSTQGRTAERSKEIGVRGHRPWTTEPTIYALFHTARVAAVALLFSAGGLVFWAVLPLTLGWTPHVVLTGSMAPSVQPGDVLVTHSLAPRRLHPGMIIVFNDPQQPGRVLAHRFQAVRPDGRITTRGDANASTDTTGASLRDVVGVARLRIPFIGLPTTWLRQGHSPLLGFAALLTAATVAFAMHRPDDLTGRLPMMPEGGRRWGRGPVPKVAVHRTPRHPSIIGRSQPETVATPAVTPVRAGSRRSRSTAGDAIAGPRLRARGGSGVNPGSARHRGR